MYFFTWAAIYNYCSDLSRDVLPVKCLIPNNLKNNPQTPRILQVKGQILTLKSYIFARKMTNPMNPFSNLLQIHFSANCKLYYLITGPITIKPPD